MKVQLFQSHAPESPISSTCTSAALSGLAEYPTHRRRAAMLVALRSSTMVASEVSLSSGTG